MAQYSLPTTIPAGQYLSSAVQASTRIAQIFLPPAWDTAPLTFQISLDGQNFFDLYNIQIVTGGYQPYEVSVPSVIPNAVYVMPPGTGHAITNIRLRSGTRALPIPQAADRTFQILFDVV